MHNPISFNLHTLFYTTWRQMQILHKHLFSSVVIQLASNLQLQMCACTYACLTNVKPVWHSWINKLKSQTGMTNSRNTDLQFQSSSWWFTIPSLKRWGIVFLSYEKVENHTGNWETSLAHGLRHIHLLIKKQPKAFQFAPDELSYSRMKPDTKP